MTIIWLSYWAILLLFLIFIVETSFAANSQSPANAQNLNGPAALSIEMSYAGATPSG